MNDNIIKKIIEKYIIGKTKNKSINSIKSVKEPKIELL